MEVWVSIVTVFALATVPIPVVGIITCAVPSTFVIGLDLSKFTCFITDRPIKNHRKCFVVF
jgi:hypothetical protein